MLKGVYDFNTMMTVTFSISVGKPTDPIILVFCICDAIKQIESELDNKNQTWVLELHFVESPIKIELTVLEI